MGEHPYEYSVLVEYLNPVPSSVMPDYGSEGDEQSLTMALQEVVRHLPEAIAEGWEVISHALTVAEKTVILSVLLRRPCSK